MRPRHGAGARLSPLELLIERRKCKREGRSFAAFVAEHHPEIERGIEWYEAQDTDEGRYLAASLREMLEEAKE